jgi:hypothetical protein
LVRHSIDRNAAAVGLALLATDGAEQDIPLIQTIDLLSDHFGPLAAEALQPHRRDAIRANSSLNSDFFAWLTSHVAARLRLDAFSEGTGTTNAEPPRKSAPATRRRVARKERRRVSESPFKEPSRYRRWRTHLPPAACAYLQGC